MHMRYFGDDIGKHTCPPKTLAFEGETTHSHDYKPYKLVNEQQERLAYNPEQRHYDTNLIQTTYNSNYTPHRIEQDRLLNPMQAYVPSRGKFEGETEYTKSYVPNQIRMDRQPDVLKYVPNSAKFDASTTYNRAYSPKHAAQQSSSGKGFEYRPSNLPFEGKTTYESEYKPHQISPTRIEGIQYHPKNTPFVGESRYKEVRMQRLSNMCHTSYNPPSYVPTSYSRLDPTIALQAKNTYNSQQPGTNGSDLSILSNIIKDIKYNRN
jgi:hypothetical protein